MLWQGLLCQLSRFFFYPSFLWNLGFSCIQLPAEPARCNCNMWQWKTSQKEMGNREGWGAGLVSATLSLAPVVPEDTVSWVHP